MYSLTKVDSEQYQVHGKEIVNGEEEAKRFEGESTLIEPRAGFETQIW